MWLKNTKYLFVIGLMVMAGGLALGGMDDATETHDNGPKAKAIFAGGCFWCVEEVFEKVDGVVSATSGYIGGDSPNPTYQQVSAGGTGYAEAVEIVYDPDKVTYQQLLDVFWKNIDPTTPDQQFCDKGDQYRSAIFYLDESQKLLAEESKQRVEQTKTFADSVVTEIAMATIFYPAEDYHQDFYKRNPVRYKFYKWNCGRAQRLEELWGNA
ncbi:MAG: peptide-methionine (S)-S-oxide reductase MsrA [Nitrospirota bacterium]|nr:MAG: peptide-methionine (S)-S-oxide reductase MsrA [Nitrospirota bacterium]